MPPETLSEPLLSALGVSWEAGGRTVLGPLDLGVEGGECVAVVGPNGAGKTTLLRLLAGVLTPTTGVLSLRQTRFDRLSRRELARHIAYVPQVRPIRVPFTVEQIILLGRYPYLSRFQLAPGRDDYDAAAQALELVGIEGLRHRPLEELSGGERQAVYVAAALAQEAEVLILDEPTTHLDARHQREITSLLLRLHRETGRTVITATHDLNLAARVAGRILALKEGGVVACEPPGRLLRPALLEQVFDAPFEIVRGGEHPVTVLELGR